MSGSLFCFVVLLYSLALERGASAAEDGDVRLVNVANGTACQGRLEVFRAYDGQGAVGWFAACEKFAGPKELSVICRQLHCLHQAPVRAEVTRFGPRPSLISALGQECSGSELQLSDCSKMDEYTCDFSNQHLIGVICSKASALQWSLATVLLLVLTHLLAVGL